MLTSLERGDIFYIVAMPFFTTAVVCFLMGIVLDIFRGLRFRKTAGQRILKVKQPTFYAIGIRVLALVPAGVSIWLLVIVIYPALHTIFTERELDPLMIYRQLSDQKHMISLWPFWSFLILMCLGMSWLVVVLFVSSFRSLTIYQNGVVWALLGFVTWNRIRRAIWITPCVIRIEYDNRFINLSMQSDSVEQVNVAMGNFVDVIDHDTFLAGEKDRYKRPRSRFQFHLRTLLIVMLLLAVFSSGLGTRLRKILHTKQIGSRLEIKGAEVYRTLDDIYGVAWNKGSPNKPVDKDLADLQSLESLHDLGVCDSPISDQGVKYIKNCSELSVLMLVNTQVTGKAFDDLGNLGRLEVLYLDGSPITDDGLVCIVKLPSLKHIGLENTKITDKGLEHLVSHQNIKSISLSGTLITDAGLQQIGELKGLRRLDLNGTQVTDAGLVHIAGLFDLYEINLDNTRITGMGFEYLALIQGLKTLSLENAPVTDDGLQKISKLKSLEYLTLNGTQVTDAGLVHLAELNNLQWLDLDNTRISDTGVERLMSLQKLTKLSLANTLVTDDGLKQICKLRVLGDLTLDGTQITDAGLKHLEHLGNLHEISLKGTKVTNKGLVHLKRLPGVWSIELSGTAVTKAAAAKMLPKVRCFEVSAQNVLLEDEPDDGESSDGLPSENAEDGNDANMP